MWICDGNNTEQLCIKPYGFLVDPLTQKFGLKVGNAFAILWMHIHGVVVLSAGGGDT